MSSSSSGSWMSSLSCSGPFIQSSDKPTSLTLLFQWLEFIFLSPCPQRALFSSVDLVFLLILFIFAIQKLCFSRSPTHPNPKGKSPIKNNLTLVKTNLTFKLSLILTALLATSYTVLSILAFVRRTQSPWKLTEALFLIIQAITHIAISVIITHEKRFRAITHPLTLRIYWVISFFISCLFFTSAILRLTSSHKIGFQDMGLKIDDVFSLISLPISAILLLFAVEGSTGIALVESDTDDSTETALKELLLGRSNVTAYATA